MENAAATLNDLSRHCQSAGIGLVLENILPHLFSGHICDLLWILGALETTDVGICLETGHASLSGDLKTVAHKLSGHPWMVHASDNNGTFDDHLPPGDGKIAWTPLWHQLDDAHFSGTIILEIAGGDSVPVTRERAIRGREFLERLTQDGNHDGT